MQSSTILVRHRPTLWERWASRIRYRFGAWLTLVFLFLCAALVLAPFAWVLATSLRLPAESFSVPPQWIPLNPQLSNYAEVFERIPFWQQILNSFTVSVSVVLGQLITASLAGYAFARLEFPFRNVFFWLVMATMMIPIQATIIPVFILMSRYMGMGDRSE